MENGELTGMVTDVVKAILTHLNIHQEIRVLPWARAYTMALNKPNVVIFTAGNPQRRAHGFTFLGPVTTRRHILYQKSGQPFTPTCIDDLRHQCLTVGAMRGDWRGTFFSDQGVRVETVTTHSQNIKKVLFNRIDLFVLSDLELAENLRLTGTARCKISEAYVFQESDAYILLSKGTDPQTIARWQGAFKALQSTNFFEKTAAHWGRKLKLPLIYTAEKGFHIRP